MSRLYIAATHLLCVDILFFSERCKRYHFENIEALWYTPTKSWHFFTVFWALVAIPGALGLFIPDIAARVIFGIWVIIAIGFLVINITRGPSCRCHIRTAAHIDELPSINRLALAERFFTRVGPLIEAAQADVATMAEAPPLVAADGPDTTRPAQE
ncbi:MAG: hypothetical protein RRC34_08435 [Lentisphaeria bacterium]|nr:hypothetical protein [Lentisphaeria bacterium]